MNGAADENGDNGDSGLILDSRNGDGSSLGCGGDGGFPLDSGTGGGAAAAKTLRDVRAEVEALLSETGFTGCGSGSSSSRGNISWSGQGNGGDNGAADGGLPLDNARQLSVMQPITFIQPLGTAPSAAPSAAVPAAAYLPIVYAPHTSAPSALSNEKRPPALLANEGRLSPPVLGPSVAQAPASPVSVAPAAIPAPATTMGVTSVLPLPPPSTAPPPPRVQAQQDLASVRAEIDALLADSGFQAPVSAPSVASVAVPMSLTPQHRPSPPQPPPPPQVLTQVQASPLRQPLQSHSFLPHEAFAAVGAPPPFRAAAATATSLEEVQREVREMMEQGRLEAGRRDDQDDPAPAPAPPALGPGDDQDAAGLRPPPFAAAAVDMTHASTHIHAKLAAVNQMAVTAVTARGQFGDAPSTSSLQQQPRQHEAKSGSIVGTAGVRAALGTLNLSGKQHHHHHQQAAPMSTFGAGSVRVPVPAPLEATGHHATVLGEVRDQDREERHKYGLSARPSHGRVAGLATAAAAVPPGTTGLSPIEPFSYADASVRAVGTTGAVMSALAPFSAPPQQQLVTDGDRDRGRDDAGAGAGAGFPPGGTGGFGEFAGDIYQQTHGKALRVLGPLGELVQHAAARVDSTDPRYGQLANQAQQRAPEHFPALLPNWAWAHVIGFLDHPALLTLGRCSKQLLQASRHEPLWRSMYLSRACWRQPDWLWEKGLGSEPTSWRQSYIERFVMLGGKQRDFGHALADEEVSQANRDGRLSFDAADRLKQEGVLRTQVALRRARMHRVRAYGFNADVGAPAPTSGGNRVYHVEWAKGSLGMRTARCTLTQMIEQMHPGETLAFEPGVYRTDAPVRVYKAIELVRHPDYGAAVGPASTIVDSVVPFAGTSHASASYAFGYSNNRAPTEFGPRAAGAVVIEAPLVAFGGGVSHAGWNGGGGGRGGGRGGSDSSGGVGGGLGRVAGVTLSCSHVSFSGHSRVLFEDVQFAGHVACFEGSAPRIMYSKLQSLSCTDQSAPEVRSCRVLYALSDASTLTALKNDGLERLGVRWGGESRGVLAGCEVTGFPEGMAALEIEHDSGCEVHRNAIHGNRGAGVRVSSRAWVKLEANEIHGNKQAGLVVDGDAPPRVTGNTLHGNGGGGIVIKGSARGTYADNTVFACGQSGIAIADVAAPTLVNNRVHGNQGAGVAIGGKAQGTAQGNSVVGNTGPGVTVSAYAQTVLEENNIHANGQSGVMVWGHARPTFLRNSIHDNAAAGVVMGEDCACTFSRNSVFGNATVGMVIGDAARGVVADNDVYENNVGVAIKGDASPEFHSNNLRNNKEGGLEAPDERVGTYMQSNHCYKNNTAAGEDNCVIM